MFKSGRGGSARFKNRRDWSAKYRNIGEKIYKNLKFQHNINSITKIINKLHRNINLTIEKRRAYQGLCWTYIQQKNTIRDHFLKNLEIFNEIIKLELFNEYWMYQPIIWKIFSENIHQIIPAQNTIMGYLLKNCKYSLRI